MQKNDKSYAFLLSHSKKDRILIKRVEVSKSFIYFGTLAVFLTFGFITLGFGINGLISNPEIARTISKATTHTFDLRLLAVIQPVIDAATSSAPAHICPNHAPDPKG